VKASNEMARKLGEPREKREGGIPHTLSPAGTAERRWTTDMALELWLYNAGYGLVLISCVI